MALYSLDEVFQMAAQMEESGREFYETVAKHSPELAKVCVGVSLNQIFYLFVIFCPMCSFVTRAGGGGLERA